MKTFVSIAALAIATLYLPSVASAQENAADAANSADIEANAAWPEVADAEAFLAKAEKDLFLHIFRYVLNAEKFILH